VVAYKIILSNPAEYGFDITREGLYPPLRYFEVKVDSAVTDFARFAQNFGTNYKILKFFNPWLRKPYLTRKQNKTYIIKIPEEGSRTSLHPEVL